MNDLVLTHLVGGSNCRILEIGFGGGSLLSRILQEKTVVEVHGIEISQLALNKARARFKEYVSSGKLQLHLRGDTDFGLGRFDEICSVNVIYFWSDIATALEEIHDLMMPGGRFLLCYSDTGPGTTGKFPPSHVEDMLAAAGFSSIETYDSADRQNGNFHLTVATRLD